MTEHTAAQPLPLAAGPRRFTESLSLFVDPTTRAYTLGRAVLLAELNRWATPRESEILRSLLDDAIQRAHDHDPERYAEVVAAGWAEMARRKADSQPSR